MCLCVCATVHACVCVCVRVICELNVLGMIKWTTTLSTQRRGRFIGHAVRSSEGRLKDSFRFHSPKLATFCGMFCDLIWKLSQIVRESFLALPKLWMKHLLWFDSSVCECKKERGRETHCKRERSARGEKAAQYRERESFYYAPSTTMLPAANEARAGNATSHSLRGSLCVHVSVWMSECVNVKLSILMYVCVCVCVLESCMNTFILYLTVLYKCLLFPILFSFCTVHCSSEWQ